MRFVIPKRCLLALLIGLSLFITLLSASELEARSITYVYDELSRIVRVIYDDGTIIEYTYDQVGNRLTKTILRGSAITLPSPSKPSDQGHLPANTFSDELPSSRP